MKTEGKALRDAFGDEILRLGKENKAIYVVDCDISTACKTLPFSLELPGQHVNVGIAEQNGCGVAAGLATTGKIPFVSTYAVFGSMRMLEQIRQEVCYPNLNVKIACSHGGLTPGIDGASHQCVEDMGVLRTIPNMTVIMGADYHATRTLVRKAAQHYGPVYLRFTKDPVPFVYEEGVELAIGKANTLLDGGDVSIIANGDTVCIALAAARQLQKQGIGVTLLDMHTIKPLDREAVVRCIDKTGKIITVEDHNIINGLGSAVCEVVAEEGRGKVVRIGVQDRFAESGPCEVLLADNGITAENIVRKASMLLAE